MTPITMTPADFKTAVESLGLTHEFVATAVGVSAQRVFLYGDPRRLIDVPQNAADTLRSMLRDFEIAADRLAAEIQTPEVECVPRYITEDEFWAAVPELQGWPLSSQAMLLAEVQRRTEHSLHIEYVTADLQVAA